MEIVSKAGNKKLKARRSSSSFECAPEAMDAILGIRSLGNLNLRLDRPVESTHGTSAAAGYYAPIEVVPARSKEKGVAGSFDDKHERLLRLLDREQAWYDARLEAAKAAEQLLTLHEHHQQQWLQSVNNPT